MSNSPRLRVAALMLVDGKVVLVRHRAGDATYHLLPGGGVDYRETVEDALVREISEETGLLARIGRPLFVSDTIDPGGTRHVVNLTFSAEVIGGSIIDTPQDTRVEAVDLADPRDLGALDLRPPMAKDIASAIEEGLDRFRACYLGSLFTPGR